MTSVPKSHFERHWSEAKLLISRVAGSDPGAAGWNSSPNSVRGRSPSLRDISFPIPQIGVKMLPKLLAAHVPKEEPL
jgi:hypothetical protein